MFLIFFCLFFFFQAEDGIRDLTVTGVQTCALPIYCRSGHVEWDARCYQMLGFEAAQFPMTYDAFCAMVHPSDRRSEEHTSELQSQSNLVCRLLLEKKKPVLRETHQGLSSLAASIRLATVAR